MFANFHNLQYCLATPTASPSQLCLYSPITATSIEDGEGAPAVTCLCPTAQLSDTLQTFQQVSFKKQTSHGPQ